VVRRGFKIKRFVDGVMSNEKKLVLLKPRRTLTRNGSSFRHRGVSIHRPSSILHASFRRPIAGVILPVILPLKVKGATAHAGRMRSRRWQGWIVGLTALFGSGCGDGSTDGGSVETGDVGVGMDFQRSAGFYDAPFPSAELQGPDGRVDVSRFPNPQRVSIINQALALIARDADGFALTAGVYFSLTGAIDPNGLPDVATTLSDAAPVFLVAVDDRQRAPVRVDFVADGGPFGAANQLSLVPYQGIPLQPETRYAAAICAELLDTTGRRLKIHPAIDTLRAGGVPSGLTDAQAIDYRAGYVAVTAVAPHCTVAGLSVFTTGAPADELPHFLASALQRPLPTPAAFTRDEVFDDYCVYSTTIDMPNYQQGTPPYPSSGGDWRVDADNQPLPPTLETANLVITVPRAAMPESGFPTAVFVRAGGGGERPLVDRGVQAETGGPALTPGSGPALEFARAGYAGVQVDGPLGGRRNTTRGDEQFLVFNVFNLAALRDNVRESALELALLARVLDDLEIDTRDCPGAPPVVTLDAARRVLMGHSTGATIAPLALAVEPSFEAVILSGAGGSYVENVLHKRKPAEILPVANLLVRYVDRSLSAYDPALNIVQWALESADPPVYAALATRDLRYRSRPAHVLMLQGIVDNYILPNIANASSLAFGLDLVGAALDDPNLPGLADQTPLLSVLPLSERRQIDFPAACNLRVGDDCVTAVVTQHGEDDVQDGHEVVFQTEPPKHQYRCFLKSLLRGVPIVPAPSSSDCGDA